MICHFQENDEKVERNTHLPSKCVRCVREEGGDEKQMRGGKERKSEG